jgi:methylmalonyl-CoA/ethylmalonyl-CoA epimerase
MLSSSSVPLLAERPIAQVGVLVEDLDRALAAHTRVAPREAWAIVEPGSEPRPGVHRYRGAPLSGQARIAFSPGVPQIELIQHLRGDSIYSEWLADHGFGLHHLAVDVEDLSDATQRMATAGFGVLQSGVGYGPGGSGGHAYFDTGNTLGYILEAIATGKDDVLKQQHERRRPAP